MRRRGVVSRPDRGRRRVLAAARPGSWRARRVPTIWTVLNRRLAPLLAAVAATLLAATGCAEQSAAVRVDDATVSRSDFEDQLDLVYENDELRGYLFSGVGREQLRAEGAPRGSYTQQYAGAMAGLHVQFLVAAQVLDNEGVELTDADREPIVAEFDQALPGGTDALPEAARDDLVDGLAAFNRLRTEFDESELNDLVDEVLDEATIVVDSRYGTWDGEQFAVTPPAGPAPAPGTADAAPEPAPG